MTDLQRLPTGTIRLFVPILISDPIRVYGLPIRVPPVFQSALLPSDPGCDRYPFERSVAAVRFP
jgi:hypothetical protein